MVLKTLAEIQEFASLKLGSRMKSYVTRSLTEVLRNENLYECSEDQGVLTAKCRGSGGEIYQIQISFDAEGYLVDGSVGGAAICTCSCPSAQHQDLCKHSLAALLYRLPSAALAEALEPEPCCAPETTAHVLPPPAQGGNRLLPASMQMFRKKNGDRPKNPTRINGRQMIQVSDEDLIAECRNILGLNITQVTEPSAQQARQTAQESSTTRIPVVVAVAVPAVARAQGINTAASPGPPHASPAIQPDEAPPPFSFEALFGPTS